MENKKSSYRAFKKRRRGFTLPTVALLVALSLGLGGLGGYFLCRRTDTSRVQLAAAQARIEELESALATTESGEEAADTFGEESGTALWEDSSLLSGMLTAPETEVVVAEFDGGTLMSGEVVAEYNDRLTTRIFEGDSADEIADSLMQEVLEDMVTDKLLRQKAAELGLDQLDDSDRAEIKAEAQTRYDGMTAVELESGVTLESIEDELTQTWWTRKLFAYVVKDVTVSDADIEAAYNTLLERQKTDFAESPENFEYAHYIGEPITYRPAGYRAVKDLLIAFENESDGATADELMQSLQNMDVSSDEYITAQSKLEALYAALETVAQEIESKLAAGESFDSLMAQYGKDDAMRIEPLKTDGYYISADSWMFSDEFMEGALNLTEIGEVSVALRSPSGLHLVQYVAELSEGEVPFEEVRDAVAATALEEAQQTCYDKQCAEWLEGAHVTYYPERLMSESKL